MATLKTLTSLLVISSLILILACSWFSAIEAQGSPPIVKGLSWTFYESSCPKVESIIRKQLKNVFRKDIGQAAGLLRLHFHDCFVQGCDASVLLDGSASGPSEQDAPPNFTLRVKAFEIIEALRSLVHEECGRVVSCSDIVTIAARDSVFLSGGPDYKVPLGSRDAVNFATQNETRANLPPPTANTSTILKLVATKNFDAIDLVALSGAHTIGIGHCSSFANRLYPSPDPSMDKTLAQNLKKTCPKPDTNATIAMDSRSPYKFDNQYYVDLINRRGLFTSDESLYMDKRTRGIVSNFSMNETLFFENFVLSMLKLGQLGVLTGDEGEVRANCSRRNSDSSYIKMETEAEEAVEALH